MSQQIVRAKSHPPLQQSQMGSMVFGYVSRTDNMEFFNNKLNRFQAEGKIPDLNKEADYTIYRWKAGFASHESIVLGCQGKFFTIEIRVMGSSLTLYTTAESVNETTLKECGKVMATGLELITKAFGVYTDMKGYNFAFNNCQDFVNNYLTAIEMVDQVRDTDAHWLLKVGSVAAIGLAAYFSYSSKKNKCKQ